MPTSNTDLRAALIDQLQRAMHGEAWHGPSVKDAVAGVSASDAAAHSIADAHSIWEIVLHLTACYDLVLRRMAGESPRLTPSQDWPAVPDVTEGNWKRDTAQLYTLNSRVQTAMATFDLERLYEPLVAKPPYAAFTQIAGLPQHDLYHAGQIVLLKRAIAALSS